MPANAFELRLAKEDGINFWFLTSPIEILGDSHVEGVECVKMKLGEKDTTRPKNSLDSGF